MSLKMNLLLLLFSAYGSSRDEALDKLSNNWGVGEFKR